MEKLAIRHAYTVGSGKLQHIIACISDLAQRLAARE
jgi:hypothetical protein